MKRATSLIGQLWARLAHERLSESEFIPAAAAIIAAIPDDLDASEGLQISHEVRELTKRWKESLQKPLN